MLQLHGENEHDLWPERFFLEQELVFSDCFHQTIRMTNLSDNSVEFSSALHSYFAVSNPDYVTVERLNQKKCLNK